MGLIALEAHDVGKVAERRSDLRLLADLAAHRQALLEVRTCLRVFAGVAVHRGERVQRRRDALPVTELTRRLERCLVQPLGHRVVTLGR